MGKNVVVGISFFILGIVVTLFTAAVILSLDTQEQEKSFSLNSPAYTSDEDCPSYSYRDLLGKWKGKKTLNDGTRQEWTAERQSDGTFEIEFRLDGPNGTEINLEKGLWSYSGCLYTSIIKSINGSPVLYQEVYRLQKLTNEKMTYTNFRTGTTYTIYRVNE